MFTFFRNYTILGNQSITGNSPASLQVIDNSNGESKFVNQLDSIEVPFRRLFFTFHQIFGTSTGKFKLRFEAGNKNKPINLI